MKKYLIPLGFLIFAVACGVAYNVDGSYVDADGWLHESFHYIPLFYLFMLLAVVSGIIQFFRK